MQTQRDIVVLDISRVEFIEVRYKDRDRTHCALSLQFHSRKALTLHTTKEAARIILDTMPYKYGNVGKIITMTLNQETDELEVRQL